MNAPLISVVVPAYGHQAFIGRCLASIAQQDHGPVELILLDDCSKDDTLAVAQRFLDQDGVRSRFQRVVCERNPQNLGAHDTINRGVSMAQGAYISLVNSDDVYYPGRLTSLLNVLTSCEARLAFSAVQCIDLMDQVAFDEEAAAIPTTIPHRARANLPTLGFSFLRYQPSISTGNLLFERSLFDQVGGFISLKYCHDWDFMLQALRWTEPAFVDQVLYGYRLHGGNSFRELSDRAAIESEIVLTRYFKGIRAHRTQNRFAPTPYNWPHVFEAATALFEVDGIWKKAIGGVVGKTRVYAGN
ncbi:glycosyltransferase family 2 protein [Azospirillum argentinense]